MLASARPAHALATRPNVVSFAGALAWRVTRSGVPPTCVIPSDLSTSANASSSSARSQPGATGSSTRRSSVVTSATGKKGGKSSSNASGLLSGVHPDSVEQVGRIVEKAQAASDRWGVEITGFLDPALAADAAMAIGRAADVTAMPWGGHVRAERVRLVMGRKETLGEPWEAKEEQEETDGTTDGGEDVDTENRDSNPSVSNSPDSFRQIASDENGVVVLVQITGNFLFDTADHRDFLGAILGTGIDRGKIGDVYVSGERGAFVMCDPAMGEFLGTALTSVRTVPVRCAVVPLSELKLPKPRVDQFTTIEASMRLDAVASAGFRMSRAKMNDLIVAGAVRVNWREGCKPKTLVAAGDVISLRGKGRVEIGAVGETAKGKFQVDVVRYL
jgi:photosystem II S4 domain protein